MHWRSWQREGLHPVQEHIFRESGCAKGSFGGCLLQAGAGKIWLLFDALTVLYISRRSRCAGAKTYWINIYSINFIADSCRPLAPGDSGWCWDMTSAHGGVLESRWVLK